MSKPQYYMRNCTNIDVSVRPFGKQAFEGVVDAPVPAGPTGGYARIGKEESAGCIAMWAYRSVIQWMRRPLSVGKWLYFAECSGL